MTSIAILYGGVDITADVDFSTPPRFICRASGDAGDAALRVRDKTHAYAPGYFHAGGTLELFIDGERTWDGWVMVAKRGYAFDVDDTTNPTATPYYWSLTGYDRNLLFTKRFLYDVANPADPSGFPNFDAGTMDDVVIADYLAHRVDLSGDGLDTTSGIEAVASPGLFEDFVLGEVGGQWREMFDDCVGQTGAVYWIGADRIVRYADDTDATAPFKLVDRAPLAGEVAVRDLEWGGDAMQLANDAFVWGAGRGSEFPTFARYEAADSIATHGRWQWSDTMIGAYQQETVLRRATTYVEGSPQHHRGHKDDQDMISCSIFEPGLTVGLVVDITSVTYGKHDTIPVRTMTITFPTPSSVRYDLLLSHTIDVPFATVDRWTQSFTQHINEVIPIIGDPTSGVVTDQSGFDDTDYRHPNTQRGIWLYSDLSGIHGDETSTIPPGEGPTFAYYFNVPYTDPSISCFYPSGSPVGFGGYVGQLYSEFWYQVVSGNFWYSGPGVDIDTEINPQPALDVVLRVVTQPAEGAAKELGIGLSSVLHPTAADLHSAAGFGAVGGGVDALIPLSAGAFTEGTKNIGGGFIRHFNFCWLVFSPTWPLEDVAYVCDIDYYVLGAGPKPPYFTGQAGSGRIQMGQLLSYWNRPGILGQSTTEIVASWRQNVTQWQAGTGVFYTSWAYVPGTLQVSYNGISLRSGLDFTESNPTNGEFTIADFHDLSGELAVSYDRYGDSTIITRIVPGNTGGGTDPGDPGNGDTNTTPVPGKSGGRVYRVKPLGQFGWGTIYDGTNCWATGSAMCLDRHTLGGYQHPDHGSPDNTPPSHRFYSGNTDPKNGGSHDDQVAAWLNGWGEHAVNVGFVPWAYFVQHLNEGRGASVSGLYAALPDYLRHSTTFTGPHEVYVNEQFGDGSFWVVDPIYPRPAIWPYDVLKAYGLALSSFGHINTTFSRITGLL